jgi:hypothetical protein
VFFLVMKQYRETFNDGYLQYGYTETARSERGKRIGSSFSAKGNLAFKEMSCRNEDYELASSMNANLDRKVKTMFPPSFREISKNLLKVVIDEVEYDVIEVDSDQGRRYLFFRLQKVGG